MRKILLASAAVVALSACVARGLPDLTAEYDALLPSVAIVEDGGHGSGVFVAPGVVLTAAHVAGMLNAATADVRLADGRKGYAHVLAAFDALDAALISTDAPGAVAPLDCAPLRAGQPVTIIGSPLKMEFVVSHGWIATTFPLTGDPARDKQMRIYVVADATISYGNSGGPVFNAAGAVVGFVDAMPPQPVNTSVGPIGVPVNGFAAIIPASAFCADVRAAIAGAK